jgi:hypothetical protein
VPVHIVLRTKLLDEDVLEAYLARLAISVEARAYGTLHTNTRSDQQEKPTTTSELLHTGVIPSDDEPIICATEIQAEGEDEPTQYVYIFWKLNIPLPRPKAKINKLSIFFTPSASLKPVDLTASKSKVDIDDEYLIPGVAQPLNLLAPFANDPALKGVKPKLVASQLYQPSAPAVKQLQRNLRSGSRRLFRAAPAFLWRLRFIPAPAPSEKGATIAALDLEITPFANAPILLSSIKLSLNAGRVEDMTPILPKTNRPGDQVTLLYKLWPGKKEDIALLPGGLPELKVLAQASVLVSKTCIPKIKFSWTTPLELPSPSRPVSRIGPPSSSGNKDQATKPIGPDTLLTSPPQLAASPAIGGANNGLTSGLLITITGPDIIEVGKEFKWSLFVVNKSEKIQRLALVAIPKRRPWVKPGQRESRVPQASKKSKVPEKDLAELILDERAVYAAQKAGVQEPTSLLCLSPDVRVGPLAPGACYETEMKFVALESGVLNLEALRVVDLTSQTQDAVDVRYLPDIIVEDDGSIVSDSESD